MTNPTKHRLETCAAIIATVSGGVLFVAIVAWVIQGASHLALKGGF